MRILILSYDFRPNLGGVATVAHEIANSLSVDYSHDVCVLSRGHQNHLDHALPYSIVRYKTPQNALLSIPYALYTLLRIHKKKDFDVAVAVLWIPDGICLYLNNLFKKKKIPFFIYAHGVEILETDSTWFKRLRKRFNFLKKLVLKDAEKIICVSAYTEKLVKDYTALSHTLVINNGVNPKLFKPEIQSTSLVFSFITVARLEDYKGVDHCLYALAELKKLGYDFIYKVVGSGPDLERLKEITQKNGLGKNVEFLGVLESKEIAKLYAGSSCFLLLTRSDFTRPNVEGFGLVFLEAAACGIPAIAGDSGGIRDAVIDGKTGLIVEPTDTKKIVEAMRKLMENKSLYEELKTQAFQRATQVLTWKNQVGILEKFMRQHVRD